MVYYIYIYIYIYTTATNGAIYEIVRKDPIKKLCKNLRNILINWKNKEWIMRFLEN